MRKLLIASTIVAVLALGAGPASAHITVSPASAVKGSFTKLTFRVPNEDDNAATNKVEIFFPEDAPIPFFSVKPVPGWTFAVAKRTLSTPIEIHGASISEVVESVTWTGGSVKPGEFQEFEVSAGPLPEDNSSIVFRALQTYDNGNVVRWIEPTPPSGEEPEHPAPELTLAAGDNTAVADDAEAGDADGDGVVIGLAIAALVVSVASAALALTRRRSTS